ncbi:MAG: hypothetical protein Phyf2KO_12590 [Phycisphaerales bacterium]
MRTHGGWLAVSACLFGCTIAAGAQQSHPDISVSDVAKGFHEEAVVVQLDHGYAFDGLSVQVTSSIAGGSVIQAEELKNALVQTGALSVRPVAPFEFGDRALAESLGLTRMYVVSLDGSLGSLEAADLLEATGSAVVQADPVIVGLQTDQNGPNDPGFPSQYSLHNLGQTIGGVSGVSDSDVDAFEAWNLTSGAGQIVIAVLDAGVSHEHPDLFHKLTDGYNTTGQGSTSDANDTFNSHGTHVAGIAAAQSNNGTGMTGMSWGSPIMPIKIANILGFTSDVWMSEGLIWAADNGARVAVISYGLDNGSDLMHAAIQYAHDRGVVVCASTGNSGVEGVKFPAKYPETIAVAATDNKDQLASFSTYGPEVTVAAPGVDIISTWHSLGQPTYGFESGTSASCPLVGGIAALVLSADPSLTPDEVRNILADSSEDLGNFGFDISFGYGRVNAHRAVGVAMGIRVCIADVNLSGRVEFSDFSAWINAYIANLPEADQNSNGRVEPTDFTAFLANYNEGCH